MPLHTVIDSAADATARVLRGVKPDRLDAPTPCAEWDVRALTNHLLQVVSALHLAGRDAAVPGDLWARDLMTERGPEAFETTAGAAADAWRRPEVEERTVRFGEMPMPAPMVAAMLVSDLAIHGWDLARATGQEYVCADDVADVTLRFLVDGAEQGRQMGIYAAARPVDADASPFERALALSGRAPV